MSLRINTVHQGDCLERLEQITAGSVDLVFADPPFNIGYEYDVYDDRRSGDEYLDWSKQWMAGISKALKPNGTFWLAIGDEYAAELKLIAQNDIGFACRSWVIWYYTFGVNCVRGFSRSHTHLFHFVKDPDKFTFNGENPAVRVRSARELVYADRRANPKGRLPDNTWILRPQDAPSSGFAPMHDTWYYARVAGTFKEREGFHGCQMPEQLLGRIIRISSNPLDLVLDPFAGSGTTLSVAKKLGRRWLGIEMSREYVNRVKQRLEFTDVGDPLDGPEDPVRSAPTTSRGKSKLRLRNGKPLPHLDEEAKWGIIQAFRESCDGHSVDFVLCNPDANSEFQHACKKRKLSGGAYVWNRLLLRIRKSGKLPGGKRSSPRLTFQEMDEFSFASEIALQMIRVDYGLNVDDFLCSPHAAAAFDQMAESFAPGFTSFQYRWAALAIRKRATKSKKLASDRFLDWLEKDLPRSVPLARAANDKYDRAGVYVVASHGQPLYVGETFNVARRIEQLSESVAWQELEPTSIKFVPCNEHSQLPGLQSILIHRTDPLLNSQLLRPKLDEAAV